MDPQALVNLVVLVLAIVAAVLSWRSVASYVCLAIAVIEVIALLPGGPW